VKIRAAIPSDVHALMALERASPTAAHWTEQQYADLFVPAAQRLLLVAEGSPDEVLGFLVAHHLAPEWELENITVAPPARRTGIGMHFLDDLLGRARETNSDAVFLEVRESNAAARALYEKIGFQQTGRRKSYYSQPLEDAVLYRLNLR
jgi:ribosomal-protein-alanine N-acetyltransferase